MEIPKRLTKLQKDALATMPFIVAGNQSEIGYIFTDAFTTDFLIELGFAEINSEIKDAEGNVATRATQYGISYVKGLEVSITPSVEGETPKGEVKMTTEATAEFVIEAGIEVPKIKRTGAIGNSKYPFGKLEVGQSFLIPGKEAKSLASTVASATARYAVAAEGTRTNRKGKEVPNVTNTRKFVVRDVEGGSRVWRTL